MKKIHIELSKKSWEELEDIREKVDSDHNRKSYDEYLKDEKKNPTMALLG